MITVYVTIGNTDNKLTQVDWSCFVAETRRCLKALSKLMHGDWPSRADDPWQNHNFCAEFLDDDFAKAAKVELGMIAKRYSQQSIIWAVAQVEFITGVEATVESPTAIMPVSGP